MRLGKATAGVLATGALLFGVPAAASASATSASSAPAANTPSATFSQFAQVADGQTIAQVDQEMGSAGTVKSVSMTGTGHFPNDEVLVWDDASLGVLGNVVQFSVDFGAPALGQPLLVTGKTALGL